MYHANGIIHPEKLDIPLPETEIILHQLNALFGPFLNN
jgi:hypothetical protein